MLQRVGQHARRNRARELAQDLVAKATELRAAQEERAALERQERLLSALVDCLQWQRLLVGSATTGSGDDGAAAESLAQLLDSEVEALLLKQLPGAVSAAAPRRLDMPRAPPADEVAPDDPAHQRPCCPDDDPFLLYRCALVQPLRSLPGPPGAGPHSELGELREVVLQSAQVQGLAIQHIESGLAAEAAAVRAAAASAAAAADRAQANAAATVAVYGDASAEAGAAAAAAERAADTAREAAAVAAAFSDIDRPLRKIRDNHITGLRTAMAMCDGPSSYTRMLSLSLATAGPDGAPREPSLARHRVVAKSLRLSQAQLHRLLDGMHVLQRAVAPVVAEIGQANTQGILDAECTVQALRQPDAAAFDRSQAAQGARLQGTEQLVARLSRLHKKEVTLRLIIWAYVLGSLSFLQIGKLIVGMQPSTPHTTTFFAAVEELAAASQAQPAAPAPPSKPRA